MHLRNDVDLLKKRITVRKFNPNLKDQLLTSIAYRIVANL